VFTTGNHVYLYLSGAFYAAAFVLTLADRRRGALLPLMAGLVLHGLYLAGRGWLTGSFYANPIFEGPFFLPWCVALCAAAAFARDREAPLAPLLGLAVVLMLLAAIYAKGAIPPTPKKTHALAAAFFVTENLGHALFYAGAALSLRAVVRRTGDGGAPSFLIWGFVVYSVSQVVGAAWCYAGWGNTFRFSPRHFSSAAIWLAFAASLHLRFTPGWTPRRRAIFAVCAAVATFVATYGGYLREMAFSRVGG
jgi:hypothetical protein